MDYYRDCFVITCFGGPLDGCAVEMKDLPEVGSGEMIYSAEHRPEIKHVYRCEMHPVQPGIRIYKHHSVEEER